MAHIYDYAIIGSGLTGLALAAALSRETQNIALIEANDLPFGSNKKVSFPHETINNGLRFMPDSLLAEKAMAFIENLTGKSAILDITDEAPITFEGGQFKSFLGFGDNPPAFYDELQYFLSSKRIDLATQPYEWTQNLFEQFKGDFMPRSYVTKVHNEGETATHVTINGSKTLHAHNFIFTGTVKDLAILLPEDAVSIRSRAKLSKNNYWNALCLDICHTQTVTDSTATHVLNGTTQDEIGPCVGRFMVPVTLEDGTQLQTSQWLTFVEHELTEDSEVVGATLKKIKRQIKRAYPTALDDIKLERIFVTPIISGDGEIKLNANHSMQHLKNFWVASPTVNEQKNLVGCLLQVESVLAALGFKVDASASAEAHEDLSAPEATL